MCSCMLFFRNEQKRRLFFQGVMPRQFSLYWRSVTITLLIMGESKHSQESLSISKLFLSDRGLFQRHGRGSQAVFLKFATCVYLTAYRLVIPRSFGSHWLQNIAGNACIH